jgi:hypothetical protein
MRDSTNSVRAVTLIEEAAALAPTDIAIRDEKDAVLAWEAELEEARHLLAEQSQASHDERRSVWASIWDAVTELAS